MFAVLLALSLVLNPAPDLRRLDTMMVYPGMKVLVVWDTCGEENAFYSQHLDRIRMCKELESLPPGVLRFFFAHEMAHAIIDQLHIPATGPEEAAADELATVTMAIMGMEDDLRDARDYWARGGIAYDVKDTHPPDSKRAWAIECALRGRHSLDLTDGCTISWRRSVWTWTQLLGVK